MEYFSGFLRHEGTEITHNLKEKCYQKDWVVYAKRPFGGPEQVIEYLGRYTHKTCTERSRSVAPLAITGFKVWKRYGITAYWLPETSRH